MDPYATTPAGGVGHGSRRGTGGRRIVPAGSIEPGLTTIPFPPCKMAKTPSPLSPPAPPAEPASYEDALAELERLVAAMEAGQLPLDRLLDSYRRGGDLLAFCRSRLEAVEQQVKVLADGQLKPWTAA